MQTIAIILVLTTAAGYIVWRVRHLWFNGTDSCEGCDGCTLKKQVCDKKKA